MISKLLISTGAEDMRSQELHHAKCRDSFTTCKQHSGNNEQSNNMLDQNNATHRRHSEQCNNILHQNNTTSSGR